MKNPVCVLVMVLLPGLAIAAENPDWAYPATPKPAPADSAVQKQVPGSAKKYTQAQIDDGFNPPDWFPDEHPPMPEIVSNGKKPARACALCHLPTGDGHPESSSLAGLHVTYLVRQMAEFKNGGRKGIRANAMIEIAKAISDEDVRAASEYFARLKPGVWTKVVETATVAKTYVGSGAMRFASPDGGTEPLGNRIIVLPQDAARAHSRDPHSGFIDYVPVGSIAKGKALVTGGGSGQTLPCAICHGATLKGLGEVPGIAGRPPIYVVRQLNDMQNGNRTGSLAELMKAVVAKLTIEDMVAIAAYLGSLEP
jgi:cytochrome c553